MQARHRPPRPSRGPRWRARAVGLGLALAALPAVAADPPPALDQLIAPFPPEVRARALALWEGEAAAGGPGPMAAGAAAVSDEALIGELRLEGREALRAALAAARRTEAEAAARLARAEEELGQWQRFVDGARDETALGRVYLSALDELDTRRAAVAARRGAAQAAGRAVTDLRVNAALQEVSLNFTWRDWGVIAAYLAITTVLGALLAGKQATMKDFFLGGRKLAWPAVCGSIIATELSAATFLIAPAIVFASGGDMTYLQLGIGTVMARFIIGYFFIPAYYEREIYSPYDYMGNQLGPRVRSLTSVLFMVGGILAQGARVYIAAKALQVITGTNITTSIILIGAVSVIWTVMGGITTVIWTDAIQFVLFSAGAVVALGYVHVAVDGGLAAAFAEGLRAGKLNLLNLNFNAREAYTLWCGLFATGWLTLASHGTDQLMAQRMFTCRSPDDARKAVVWSSASQLLTVVLLLVGAGIFVYYRHVPLTAPERVIVDDDAMKVFAVFIVDVMPPMLSGLLMAALFATAISTLDSTLAALSQTTVSLIYRPYLRPAASDRHYVRASRAIVLIWGVLLTAFAIYCDAIAARFGDLIQFALAMAAYTYGALLGTFLLAFLPTKRDDLGLMWGVPLSVLTVFALNWHQPLAQALVAAACLVLLVQAFRHLRPEPGKVLWVGAACGVVLLLSMAVVGPTAAGAPAHIALAWPWHFPIGTAMTFGIGYLVGNRAERKGCT